MPRANKTPVRLWAVALWLLAWQGAAMLVGQDFLLAPPLTSLLRFLELARTAQFWGSALFSLARILGGFLLGLSFAALTAALSARFRRVREAIAPLILVLRAIPVASFVVVALIWMPSRNLSVLISFLIVYPLLYGAILDEIGRADPRMLEMARLFRMPRRRRLAYIYFLPALTNLEASCAAAMGVAWKSGVAAELISIPAGSIGEKLYKAKVYLMTGDLFAWTLLIVLLSALCARLFTALMRRVRICLEGV